MGREKHLKQKYPLYVNPFSSPRANPKHAYNQVVGETEKDLHDRILEVQTRKRS